MREWVEGEIKTSSSGELLVAYLLCDSSLVGNVNAGDIESLGDYDVCVLYNTVNDLVAPVRHAPTRTPFI